MNDVMFPEPMDPMDRAMQRMDKKAWAEADAEIATLKARLAEAVAVLKQVNGCRDGLCAECQYKLDNFLRPTVSASGGEA